VSIKKGVGSLQFLAMERILKLNRKGVQTEKICTEKICISLETIFKI